MTQETDPRTKLDLLMGKFASELGATLHAHPELVESDTKIPALPDVLKGRQALVVVAGAHFKEDLDMLRGYIKEYKPVLIGIDTGADALLDARLTPDIIVGNLDSMADASVNCGALLLAHSQDAETPAGIERVRSQELTYQKLPWLGTNRDAGLLVADALDAPLIVAVGTNDMLADMVDTDTSHYGPSMITHLRLGARLINAKGVSLLYRRQFSNWFLAVLALAGLLALGVALIATEAGQTFLGLIGAQLDGFFNWIANLFSPGVVAAPPSVVYKGLP